MYVDAVSSSSGSDFEDDHFFQSKRIAAAFSVRQNSNMNNHFGIDNGQYNTAQYKQ